MPAGHYVDAERGPLHWEQYGMTLRDYFAIQFAAQFALHSVADGNETAEERCSRRAYEYADALIAERMADAGVDP
jgi:hypothetical protein